MPRVLWLALAIALFACERDPRHKPPPPRPPAPPPTLLERARALKLSRPVTWEAWGAVPVESVRTEAMDPEHGLALWFELREHEAALGAAPLVVDVEIDSNYLPVDEPKPTRHRTAAELFAARANTIDRMVELLVETDAVKPDAVPKNMSWKQFVRWCKTKSDFCVEDDFIGDELTQLAAANLEPVDPEPEPSFYFTRRNAIYAEAAKQNGLDMPKLSVRVVLVTGPAHELPRHLGIGGWNECPWPDEHVLVFDDWQRRYGARPVFYGGDTIEMYVERPPTTTAELKQVAREQLLYCEDIVFQGTGTAVALAEGLAGARTWFFWWD